MKRFILSASVLLGTAISTLAQNVGIGNTQPLMKLHVAKSDSAVLLLENTQPNILNASAAMYFKIGDGIAPYTGAIKTTITGSNAARMGLFTYTSNNPNTIKERLSITDNGMVGIGTIAPQVKLHVAGDAYVEKEFYAGEKAHFFSGVAVDDDVTVGGAATFYGAVTAKDNVNVAGDITTHGGGVAYNTQSALPLKIYRRTAQFEVVSQAPQTFSAEAAVGINGNFTVPPSVMVADIVSNTGTGPLHFLQLVVYDVTTTDFKVRILNAGKVAISQICTWNIVCIGL